MDILDKIDLELDNYCKQIHASQPEFLILDESAYSELKLHAQYQAKILVNNLHKYKSMLIATIPFKFSKPYIRIK